MIEGKNFTTACIFWLIKKVSFLRNYFSNLSSPNCQFFDQLEPQTILKRGGIYDYYNIYVIDIEKKSWEKHFFCRYIIYIAVCIL